jgi:hypothetical protein
MAVDLLCDTLLVAFSMNRKAATFTTRRGCPLRRSEPTIGEFFMRHSLPTLIYVTMPSTLMRLLSVLLAMASTAFAEVTIRQAKALVEPAIAEGMEILGRAVKVSGRRIVVFNPLPWKRHDVVELAAAPDSPTGKLLLRDVSSNHHVPAECDGKTIRFLAFDLPALGYRTFVIGEAESLRVTDTGELKADPITGVLENRFLRIKLDAGRGAIASLIDKGSGRELVAGDSKYGLGQYLYERFDDDNVKSYLAAYGTTDPWVLCKSHLPPANQVPYAAASPKGFALTARADAVSATSTMSAAAGTEVPHAVSTKVTLCRDMPMVDLEWSIKNKSPDFWPEAGWLCLPLRISEPRFRPSRLGSIVDPAKDICRKSNLDVFCLNGGMTVRGKDDNGIGICPMDSPLVSLASPGLLQFHTDWSPREPVVFVNLFNNVWGCNFQQWIGGSWSSRIRIWSTKGENNEENLITPSWEARSCCLAVMVDGPAGTLPPEQSGLVLSRKGVMVTAFGEDPDGNAGTLLRLWEESGASGSLTVTLPTGLKAAKAQPVNLRGEKTGQPIPVTDGKLTFTLPAYAPASFILQEQL